MTDADLLILSTDEEKRQAIDALRGYKYQVYQSVSAWLALGDDETLLLEVAEDYSVVSSQVARITQVKDTKRSGNITVKTPSVAALIKSLWDLQELNSDKLVTAAYLTTSSIGKEKPQSFPQGMPGLAYWRVAARDNVDIQPIREAIALMGLPEDVKSKICSLSDQELRARVLRRIQWLCGEHDIAALDKSISDSLIQYASTRSINAVEAEKGKAALLAKIWDVIVDPSAKKRTLNRADFLKCFDAAISTAVPTQFLTQLIAQATGFAGAGPQNSVTTASAFLVKLDSYLIPKQYAPRDKLVEQVLEGLRDRGAVWLYGSSGLGNVRSIFTGSDVEHLYNSSRFNVDGLGTLVESQNSENENRSYYNPGRDLEGLVGARVTQPLYSKYGFVYDHRIEVKPGVYWQRDYGSSPVITATYAQHVNYKNDFDGSVGVTLTRQDADGTPENDLAVILALSKKF